MPSKTKTALAALFILGPISVVVLAGPNNRIDDRGSVRAVSVAMSTECVSSLRRLLNTGINPARARSSAPQFADGADAFRVYC